MIVVKTKVEIKALVKVLHQILDYNIKAQDFFIMLITKK
jgi:hypothetical protein